MRIHPRIASRILETIRFPFPLTTCPLTPREVGRHRLSRSPQGEEIPITPTFVSTASTP